MVDDHDVLYRSGTQRVVRPLKRATENPLIKCDRPWEVAIAWTTVHRDARSGRYQLWYQAWAGPAARDRARSCVVCYAESKDGIHFTKPDLDLFPFNDVKKTNIVLVANGGTSDRYANSVLYDPRDADPARRYKMAYFDFAFDEGREYPGLCVAFSPDGIHWTKHPKAPLLRVSYGAYGEPVPFEDEAEKRPWAIPLSVADATDVFCDDKRGVFAFYGKMWIDGPDGGMRFKHGMGRTESHDFIHWSRPQLILTPDDLDAPYVEFHTSPVFLYADRYFCLNQILNRSTGGGVIDIELMVSPDGLAWERPFRDQFVLARGPAGNFDSGSIFTNSTPIVLDDEIRFYYGAYSQGATGADDTKLISGIGLAAIPRDRFAGIRPVARSDQPTLKKPLENIGQVTLRPLDLSGCGGMTVNADASRGSVGIELLDADGRRVRGFTRDDAVPLHGDSLRHVVKWKNRDMTMLPPGRYHVRLHLENATVYALTLAAVKPDTRPASQKTTSPDVQILRDLEYIKNGHERNRLDLYLPEKATRPMPVIVWVHGGGWQRGDKTRCPVIPFTAKGYAVAAINYRFSQHAVFPAQIHDCKAAIRWLRANARKYGLDPNHIGAGGGSAGGHLVALLGTTAGVKEFEGPGGNEDQSSRVQAVVDWYGPSDFLTVGPKETRTRLIGGDPLENREKAIKASPITYVSKDSAPFLIMHGDKDKTVPISQSETLARALEKAGVEVTFIAIKGAGHGGRLFTSPENMKQVEDFFDRHLAGRQSQGGRE